VQDIASALQEAAREIERHLSRPANSKAKA
jgi:hypothetical protein